MVQDCTGVGLYCNYGGGLYRRRRRRWTGSPRSLSRLSCFLLLGHRPFCCVFAIIRIWICPLFDEVTYFAFTFVCCQFSVSGTVSSTSSSWALALAVEIAMILIITSLYRRIFPCWTKNTDIMKLENCPFDKRPDLETQKQKGPQLPPFLVLASC